MSRAEGRIAMRRRWGPVGWHLVLLAACTIAVFPLGWALITSFKPTADVFGAVPLPIPASLEHYRTALVSFPIARLLGNTLLTAGLLTLANITLAIGAAYALVVLPLRRRRLVLALFTVALLVPAQTLVVPHFLAVARLGWLDTLAGLVVPQLGGAALAVLLLRQHVAALPPNLFAAARCDGARPLEVLRHIALPQLGPGLGAVAVLVFITVWNEYLWPTLVATTDARRLIQPGLVSFTVAEGANPGPLLAAAVLATLPVVAVYAVAARRVQAAFRTGGPK